MRKLKLLVLLAAAATVLTVSSGASGAVGGVNCAWPNAQGDKARTTPRPIRMTRDIRDTLGPLGAFFDIVSAGVIMRLAAR